MINSLDTNTGSHTMSKHILSNQLNPVETTKPSFWGLVFIDDLNNCWARHASQSQTTVTDRIRYERITDNGQWEAGALQVGGALLHYDEQTVTVVKSLLQDTRFRLQKALGETGRRVHEIRTTWPSAQARLTIKISLDDIKLVYRKTEVDGIQLLWTGQADFQHTGGDYSWAAIMQHYDKGRRTTLYQLPPPSSAALMNMEGECCAVSGLFNFIFNPVQANAIGADKLNDKPAKRTGDYLALIFSRELFPEIAQEIPPFDSNWATGLVVPPGSVQFTEGFYDQDAGYYTAGFRQPSVLEARHRDAQVEIPLSITPLLRVVGAGAARQMLTLEPSGVTGQWAFAGPAVGTLGNESGQWFYQPPAVANPAATLKADNKTNVPAVVRSTLAFPVAADVINASAGARSATSTFVTVYAQETHYFKARLSSGKVQLILCYKDRSNNEVQVPATNTRWTVKAGNGTVSATGIFTPASSQPTPFTVLMAEDVDGMLLYWAYIVLALPTLEPEKVVEYING